MKYTFSLFLIALSLITIPAIAQLQIINTVAGDGTAGYSGDGAAATSAALFGPLGVAVDNSGNIYIEDVYNHRIRKVNASGEIVTYAGTGAGGYSGDGAIATSAAITPNGVAVDKYGNVYVSDAVACVVRKISTDGIITTVAGTGVAGYTGDGAAAASARLSSPCGIAVDTAGNLFIADAANNVIREVSGGIINTIAGLGSPGYLGDGSLATNAELDSPFAVAVDNYHNIYISDFKNNLVRKIDTTGTINRYAGTFNAYGYTGDLGAATSATLNGIRGLAVDANRNLFIADANNNVIRKVDTFGIITTAAGNGYAGFGGDLGTVNGANLSSPYGVAVDAAGSLYIADGNNERIRKTYSATLGVKTTVTTNNGIAVYPNPFYDNIIVSGLNGSDKVAIYDITGRQVSQTWAATGSTQSFSINGLSAGVYMLQVFDNSGSKITTVRLVKE